MRDAHRLIGMASPWAAMFFREHGGMPPIYHGLRADGHNVIIPVRGDNKDVWVAMARAAFAMLDATACVFICEAWMRDGVEPDEAARWLESGIANDPKRIEVVILNAEDAEGMVLARRPIIRHRGRPHLGDLKVLSSGSDGCMFEGRMVGLLPVRETRQ